MSRATAVTLVFMTQYSYSVSTCIGLSVCGTRHTLFVAHVCQRKGCTFFDASRSALSSSLVAMHTGCVAREIRFATWRACKPPLDGTRSAPAQSAAASRSTAATRQSAILTRAPRPRRAHLRAAVSFGVRYSAHLSASTATSIVAMPSGGPSFPERMCAVARSLSVM